MPQHEVGKHRATMFAARRPGEAAESGLEAAGPRIVAPALLGYSQEGTICALNRNKQRIGFWNPLCQPRGANWGSE